MCAELLDNWPVSIDWRMSITWRGVVATLGGPNTGRVGAWRMAGLMMIDEANDVRLG